VNVHGWMAHLADRLRHRRSGSFDNARARRERLGEPLRVRWYGFADSLLGRWEGLTYRYRARRERLGEPLRVRWYGFTDSLLDRWEGLTYRYRARRERLSRSRAERSRQSVAPRSPAMVGASLCVVVMIAVAVVMIRAARMAPPAPPMTASIKPSLGVRGIHVPDVRGMQASEARAELEHAGLKFAQPRAALGAPGQVLWTEPDIGRSVPPGTPVTIVIGVEAERLGSANHSSSRVESINVSSAPLHEGTLGKSAGSSGDRAGDF
jgi:hypothetical protein